MNGDINAELLKHLRALLMLQLAHAPEDSGASKPELLLSRAGFTLREIAQIVGKNENAVGVAIHRAKNNHRKQNDKR